MRDATLSDIDLMVAIAGGDQRAFQALLERHLHKAHAIAYRLLNTREDAEEAVQDAFSRVYAHAARFDPLKAGFGTWLYRILTRLCLDRLRRFKPVQTPVEDMAEEIADDAPSSEVILSQSGEARHIRDAVATLPEAQRLAIVLCYFEDMSVPEAAKIMDKHIKAVEGLLVRARKALRAQLEYDNDAQ